MITCTKNEMFFDGRLLFHYYKGGDLYYHIQERPKVIARGNIDCLKEKACRYITQHKEQFSDQDIDCAKTHLADLAIMRREKRNREYKKEMAKVKPMNVKEVLEWRGKIEGELNRPKPKRAEQLIAAHNVIEAVLNKCDYDLTLRQSILIHNYLQWCRMIKTRKQ